jgi:hypothetical protein
MLNKEISEIKKEIEIADSFNKYITPTSKEKEEFLKCSVDLYDNKSLTQIRQMVLNEKLSTLKECQAKFNQQEESKGILKEVVENIIKKSKEDLSEPINYFWSNYYNKDKPIGWYDLYQFLDCLEIMKYQGEKVIEAKEGHTCVVEKTRDKYLKDECIRFLDLINKSAQQKFDKFKQKVKELLIQHTNLCIQQNKVEIAGYLSGFHTELDKLSSKEGEE